MRKINKINNIALIFMLGIGVFLCSSLVYPSDRFCLRPPINVNTSPRRDEALQQASAKQRAILIDKTYLEQLRGLIHSLHSFAFTFELYLGILNIERPEELANLEYPEELQYQRARAYLRETNDPTLYVWEATKQVNFFKDYLTKYTEFLLSNAEKIQALGDTQKQTLERLQRMTKEAMGVIQKFEFRVAKGRMVKDVNLHEWSERCLKPIRG